MSMGELKYAFICAFSWLSLLLERVWRSYWPALSLIFAFTGLACLGALTFFGEAAHLVFLACFAVGIAYFFIFPRFLFRLPRAHDVRRAIERQSGLANRPLEALTDRPVEGTSYEATKLWDKYQDRLRNYRDRLKVHRPAAGVSKRDRYALRHAALLLLAIGLFAAQREAGYRLLSALQVDTSRWVKHAPVALDVWITPPDYTGVSPVFLATTQLGTVPSTGKIRVPENSVLKVRVSGFSDAPDMSFGGKDVTFTKPAARSFSTEIKLSQSGELKLTKGFFRRKLGDWAVYVTPDAPPDITVLDTEKTAQGELKIIYTAKDDYGIKKITGTVTPTPEIARALGARPVDFKVPVSSNDTGSYTHVEDLTAHPFAGSEVTLTLTAEDDAGNKTQSAPRTLVLPERDFKNPVAKRIAFERKRLIWFNNPLTQLIVMGNLADIANRPLAYHYDTRVFLGLDVAVKRLNYEGEDMTAVNSLIPLLWEIALRVEDGGMSLAGRELSDALQRLSEALKNKDLTKEQLQNLMDEVHQKMRQYAKTLVQEMRNQMQNGKDLPTLSPELAAKLMKHIDMDKMLKEMQQLAQGGDREMMRKMAERLKRSVDNLDLKRMEQMQEAQRKQIKALNDLQKLIDRQQSLLDKTHKMPEKPSPSWQQQMQEKMRQLQEQQEQQRQQQQQEKQGDKQQGKQQSGEDNKQAQQQGRQQGKKQGEQQGDSGTKKNAQSGQQQSAQSGTPGQMPPQPSPDNSSPGSGHDDTQQGSQGQQTAGQQGGQQQGGSQGMMPPQPSPQQGGGSQGTQMGRNGQPQFQPGQNGMKMPMPGQQGQQMPSPYGQKGDTGTGHGDKPGKGKNGNNGNGGADTAEDTPPQDITTPGEGAKEQQNIRGKLGDIMRSLGEGMPQVPENFGKSDQAMEQSQKALAGGSPHASGPAQQEALEQLQKGLDETMKQMAKQMQESVMSFGGASGKYGEGYDPLGRATGNNNGQVGEQDIQLPSGKERRRVQQIIQELRARSNDYNRPKVERDYIDRLLDQFN
ncbi:MAG: DUF4175 family protein [Alphaproteobacteria bacterium]|nr:DUF4175 family protein [Alphaproteobacteria bacterium]